MAPSWIKNIHHALVAGYSTEEVLANYGMNQHTRRWGLRPQGRGNYKRTGAILVDDNRTGGSGATWRREPKENRDVSDSFASSSKEASHQKFRSVFSATAYAQNIETGLRQALQRLYPTISQEKVDKDITVLREMYDLAHDGNTYFWSDKCKRSVRLDEIMTAAAFREMFY